MNPRCAAPMTSSSRSASAACSICSTPRMPSSSRKCARRRHRVRPCSRPTRSWRSKGSCCRRSTFRRRPKRIPAPRHGDRSARAIPDRVPRHASAHGREDSMTIDIDEARTAPRSRQVARPAAPEAANDPLLAALAILAGLLERPISAEALRAGLPVLDEQLSPELIVRAASRAGLQAEWRRQKLTAIAPGNLPCLLLLEQGGACVLSSLDRGEAAILLPGTNGEAVRLPLAELEPFYAGHVLFARAEYRFDARTEDVAPKSRSSWFWGTLQGFWRIYLHAAVASIVINLFTLASPLFVMNIYDRVVPNNAVETMWVLASGVFVVFVFDFILRTARSYFVDSAGKNADVVLASRIFAHVIGMRYDARPSSVGALAANLREFENLRELVMSSTLVVVADLPFAALFIVVIALIAGPAVALVPLLAVPVLLAIGFLLQMSLREVIGRTMREGFQKHAILVESLEGLDTIKIAGAEGRAQRLWERFVGATARTAMKARFLSTLGVNAAFFVQNMVSVLVVVIGVFKISEGALTTGALVVSAPSEILKTPMTTTRTLTMFCTKKAALTPSVDRKRAFIAVRAVAPTKRSHSRCARPSAPAILMVSSPSSDSTRMACFWNPSRIVRPMTSRSDICSRNPIASNTGTASSGTNATAGPAISAMTTMNSAAKGRSATTTNVEDITNSRRFSNSRRLAASAPTELGRAS